MEKSAKPQSILIATPLLPSQSGGPAQYAVGLTEAFVARGHAVAILAFQEVAYYPSGIRHLMLFGLALKRMRRVDIVIVLDTLSIALPVVIAACILRKKVVVRTGGDFVWERYIERTHERVRLVELYTASRAFSLKERFALWLQKHVVIPLTDVLIFSTVWQWNIWAIPFNVAGTHVRVIENAYLPHTERVRPPTRSNTIVWIGRDIVLKNVAALDHAIVRVTKEYPDLEYKKYSDIPHDRVLDILRSCRMLVIPSISEVSPNLALEALALGVPVVLTQECGLRDYLNDSVTWIDPLSVDDIASKIRDLMDDGVYARAEKRARQHNGTRTYADVAAEFIDAAMRS